MKDKASARAKYQRRFARLARHMRPKRRPRELYPYMKPLERAWIKAAREWLTWFGGRWVTL